MQQCAIHCFTIYPVIRDVCHGEGRVMWEVGTLVQSDVKPEGFFLTISTPKENFTNVSS